MLFTSVLGRLVGLLGPFMSEAGASFGYRILAVSRTYTMLSSAGSLGAELGSPPKTMILSRYAVML